MTKTTEDIIGMETGGNAEEDARARRNKEDEEGGRPEKREEETRARDRRRGRKQEKDQTKGLDKSNTFCGKSRSRSQKFGFL